MGQKATQDVEPEKKKLDLSVAQVAGTSLATVAAAVLASQLGVYGTIGGAAVVSVVATAGGPVIQHFFRRTGDQLRETVRPGARQVPLSADADGRPGGEGRLPAEEKLPDGTILLRAVPADPAPDGDFGRATVHGTRVRGWKRTAVAAGAAFAIATGGLGTYEAIAGTSVSSDGRTLLTGGAGTARDHKNEDRRQDPGTGGKGREGGGTPESGTPSPHPSGSRGGGESGSRSPSPEPDTPPSATPSPPVTPSPPPVTPSAPVSPSTRPSTPAAPDAATPPAPPAGGGSGPSSGS
ncbi:hypothetical protein ACFWSF_39875 [Streptomyces sp. NPDC058611]|uniref:hypothetical protein n=1 Tax=unclassified Streptomyces TaxID=2593676 RepID=UPI0036468871